MQDLHPLQQIDFGRKNQAYVIEASAGTGKTWTIERLFVKALLEGMSTEHDTKPIGIENILVVTFTNDATDELKERISDQLYTTLNQLIYFNNHHESVSDISDVFSQYLLKRMELANYRNDITLLTRALQNFDTAAIFTIHGFCNKVLEDYRLECKINTKFELVTDHSAIIEQLVINFMRQKIINNPLLANCIETVLANLELLFATPGSVRAETLAGQITRSLPSNLFKIEHGNYILKYKINVSADLSCLQQSLTSIAEEQRSHYLKQLKALVFNYLIEYVAANYANQVNKSNQISFDDLIQKVADSIKNSKILADKLFNYYPIAFIDEFQDTDSLQWQIFSHIYQLNQHISAPISAMNTGRGHVVVVGDPKQAIYSFRGADIDAYIEARDLINAKLDLTANFRSHNHIVNFINQLFSLDKQNVTPMNSFLGSNIGYTEASAKANLTQEIPAIEKLNAVVPELDFYSEAVQLVVINGKTKVQREQRLLDSMALEILALVTANSKLKGKIAILVTKNKEAAGVVGHLRQYGIKAVELKLGSIYATVMAQDLLKVLNAVNDLSKRREFIAAITTRVFNLHLASLNNIGETISPELERLKQQFFKYNRIWEDRGIIALVYELVSDVINTVKPGRISVITNRDVANLWQLAELLNKQSKHLVNHFELLYWFKQKIINANEATTADIDGVDEDLVRLDNDDEQITVTTQHKAKGLEYEILFCPYFRSGATLDGAYDYSYQRPFFSCYRDADCEQKSEIIVDDTIGNQIVATANKEVHRLNYVALTRAKSRIYIYLKQNTYSNKNKYHHAQKPDKLAELFGFVANDVNDVSHSLFNYPEFFGSNPMLAIKDKELFPGVVVYNRDNINQISPKRPLLQPDNRVNALIFNTFKHDLGYLYNFNYRQSYTGLTQAVQTIEDSFSENYVKNEVEPNIQAQYKYEVLSDKNVSGAKFGLIFHGLCEIYPFSTKQLKTLLCKYDVNHEANNYVSEFKGMLDEAFNFNILSNRCLLEIAQNGKHELEFNLHINHITDIGIQVSGIIAKHFGVKHPFTLACKTLRQIERGFLVGFIDLLFEHDGKYWVLDYKTNKLDDYTNPHSYKTIDNQIIESMAEHHYYLQYLLYLVAVKRYLEVRLKVGSDESTRLIGGAVYYYVRGVYTESVCDKALYIDDKCCNIVCELDNLFKGIAANDK